MTDDAEVMAQGRATLAAVEQANADRDNAFFAKLLEQAGDPVPGATPQTPEPTSPTLAQDQALAEASTPPVSAGEYDLSDPVGEPATDGAIKAKVAEMFHGEQFDHALATACWSTVIREANREYSDVEIEGATSEGMATLTRRHGSAGAKGIIADAQKVLARLVGRMPELKSLHCPGLSNAEVIEMLAIHQRRKR